MGQILSCVKDLSSGHSSRNRSSGNRKSNVEESCRRLHVSSEINHLSPMASNGTRGRVKNGRNESRLRDIATENNKLQSTSIRDTYNLNKKGHKKTTKAQHVQQRNAPQEEASSNRLRSKRTAASTMTSSSTATVLERIEESLYEVDLAVDQLIQQADKRDAEFNFFEEKALKSTHGQIENDEEEVRSEEPCVGTISSIGGPTVKKDKNQDRKEDRKEDKDKENDKKNDKKNEKEEDKDENKEEDKEENKEDGKEEKKKKNENNQKYYTSSSRLLSVKEGIKLFDENITSLSEEYEKGKDHDHYHETEGISLSYDQFSSSTDLLKDTSYDSPRKITNIGSD